MSGRASTTRACNAGDGADLPTCASCARFLDDPFELERALQGLGALSSALGSTRGRAGICEVTGRLRDPAPACREYRGRGSGEISFQLAVNAVADVTPGSNRVE